MSFVVVVDDPHHPGDVVLVDADESGEAQRRTRIRAADLPEHVRRREAAPTSANGQASLGATQQQPAPTPTLTLTPAPAPAPAPASAPRWVWADTSRVYPTLLAAGVRVERCHDLRLCHAILRRSVLCAGSELATAPPGPWDLPGAAPTPASPAPGVAPGDVAPSSLFDDELTLAPPPPDPLAELRSQLAAIATATEPGRLRLLLAAESVGALIAAEMRHTGMPWDAAVHDRLLTEALGPRPPAGTRPARLEALAAEVRTLLDRPGLNLDSQPDLLRAMRSAGLPVTSTRTHELREVDHPAVAPLLEYKKLARLLSANGWHWLDTWVHDGRFRPDYVPAGVVTGRWATSGGGALQLPAAVRAAVRADPGWSLVVADAAQLEPRVLAAMSGDGAMAAAGRNADLYQAVVDAGVVETRTEAKYAMLGAIYGATTGAGGVLMPRLARAYPRAVGLVEAAARTGERGDVVSTWLGRTSPPDLRGTAMREVAVAEGADPEEVRAARQRGRDWGRFTRNFVVQGTAAEWALCWMAGLRQRLRAIEGDPHLVLFLHDEVVVHAPSAVAAEVADAVTAAAADAGRLLFDATEVEFSLEVHVVESYDQAK